METFQIQIVLFSLYRIRTASSRIKCQFRFAEHSSNIIEHQLRTYEYNQKYSFVQIDGNPHYMRLQVKMPDTRFKIKIDTVLENIAFDMV